MKEIGLNELKKNQIEILDFVSDFCEKNKINYFLDCGTLLGCIRHHGFIPWDDDIDIGMLRSDFDRFKTNFSKNGRYIFVSAEIDNKYPYTYGKILDTTTVLYEPDQKGVQSCINIDVFVYDNAPDDEMVVKKMFNRRDKLSLLNSLQYRSIYSDVFYKKFVIQLSYVVLKVFPKGYFAKKMLENEKLYMHESCNKVGNFTSFSRVIGDKSIFEEYVYADFEGRKYKIPVGYDKWLSLFYGNYMQLPPENKRVSHHKFEAFRI